MMNQGRIKTNVFSIKRKDCWTKEEIIAIIHGAIKFYNIDMLIQLAHTSKQLAKRKDIKYSINT